MQQPPQGPNQPYENTYYSNQQPAAPQWTQVTPPGQGYQSYQGYQGYQPNPQGNPASYSAGQMPPPAQIQLPPQYAASYEQQPVMPPQQQGYAYDPQPKQDQQIQQPSAQQGYKAPKTGIPQTARKNNKPLIIALVALVGFFLVFACVRLFTPGQAAYGLVKMDTLSARYTGDALVVRSETVYLHTGTSQVSYEAEEGADVTRGTTVATAYTSGFSSKELNILDNFRKQIKTYHKSLIQKTTNDNVLISRMQQVTNRVLEAQQLVQGARGSLGQQEKLMKHAMDQLRLYLKEKYNEDSKLTHLYEEEENQERRISNWSKKYAAPTDGLISFYTDGFESALNMQTIGNFSPAQVRSMYKGNIPEKESSYIRSEMPIYRLVRKEPWSVLMLCKEKEWTPVIGRTYHLLIESFDNTTVQATIASFTRSGGELLIQLLIEDTQALEDVLYIRSCQVTLGENVNSLVVPSRAIYVQNGRKGVVMRTEAGDMWMSVEVISDDGVEAHVIPEVNGVLHENTQVRLF